MSTKRKPPKVAAIREAIADAAVAVFARSGYAGATMAQIAEEAGYSASALYNYFDGKEAIFAELVSRLNTRFLDSFEASTPASLTFAQRLELLMDRHRGLMESERGALQLLMGMQMGGGGLPGPVAKLQADGFVAYMARLTSWIEAAAGPDDLGSTTPSQAAMLYWSIQNAFMLEAFAFGGVKAGCGDDGPPLALRFYLWGVRGQPPGKGAK